MQITQVLIAGAGPVGLTLAADLASRGIECCLVEPLVDVHPNPRAISIGVRTMEHYRRLGLDQRTIEAGVPRTHKLDVVYVTRVLGRELYRFEIPSIADLETDRAALAQRVPEIAASIAGAGPVGLTLAADLASRGIECCLVEPLVDVHPHPRAISIGVRTMEHYRRLGLDQRTIEAGVPRTHKLDVVYVTRVLGRELYRFEIPSIANLETDRVTLARRVPEIAASPYYKTW